MRRVKKLFLISGVRGTGCTSNNTIEVEKTLGIEAARYTALECFCSRRFYGEGWYVKNFISVFCLENIVLWKGTRLLGVQNLKSFFFFLFFFLIRAVVTSSLGNYFEVLSRTVKFLKYFVRYDKLRKFYQLSLFE